jgi:hypothetical protein
MRRINTEMKVIPGGNQMSLIRDTEEVVKFLEFAGRKSILNEHAIGCRLTACHNLFAVVNEEEDNLDYILNNLDLLINRFRNRNNNVRASTLKVYKSRVKSSIEDFKAWGADPFAWERAVIDKAKSTSTSQEARKEKRKPAATDKKETVQVKEEPLEKTVETPLAANSHSSGARKVSFPIRPNFCVEMVIPPEGLSLKELHRIGLFLYPYCYDIDPSANQTAALGFQS